MSWQYKIGNGPLATGVQLGIESHSGILQSRGIDKCTLLTLPSIATPAYGTLIEICYNGTRRFLGRVTTTPLVRSGTSKRRKINLDGPQWWLQRIQYQQTWSIYYGGALGPQPSSRIILNQDATGANISVESQLHAIISYANTAGAPLQFGLASVGMTLPFDEQRDLSCLQSIERVLRFAPDVCSWTDYSTSTPTIYFGQGAQIAVPAVEDDDVTVRNDLVVPGLTIQIERICTVNNAQYRTIQTLTAGNTSSLEAISATLTMAGSEVNQTYLTANVTATPIPTVNQAAAWWKASHPRLANIATSDITVVSNNRYVNGAAAPNVLDYPNISATSLPDLTPIGLHVRVEQWIAVVNLVQRDGNGNVIAVETGVQLDLDVITTDATTQTYKIMQSEQLTGGEPCPADLATTLLTHWSVLYSQGSAQWPLASLWPVPGQLYNATTPIQVVRFESLRNTASVDFGPPQHIEISGWASRLQGFRTRRPTYSWSMRTSAGSQQGGALAGNPITPSKSSGSSPGAKQREVFTALDAASNQQTIDLNPANVAFSATAPAPMTLSPREVFLPIMEADNIVRIQRVQVLCSAPYGPKTPVNVSTYGVSDLLIGGFGYQPGAEAPETDVWEISTAPAGQFPVVKIDTRGRYYSSGDKKWYAYSRWFEFDPQGHLVSISPEERIVVDAPVGYP